MKSIRLFLLESLVIGTVLSVIAQVHSQDDLGTTPVRVGRRATSDVYNTQQTKSLACNVGDNVTYLVADDQCVDNHDLFNECLFALTPVQNFSNSKLDLKIIINSTLTLGQTTSGSDVINAVVTIKNGSTTEQVSGSVCYISTLEVYRGREQAIEISYKGFSLSDNGSIEVHGNQLVYNSEDYLGELYRMNLSCSGGGLRESGCLFFKMIGMTDIREAKFNCSVPGTLPTNTSECPLIDTATTPISSEQQPTTLPLTSVFTQLMTDSTVTLDNPLITESTLFYAIVGVMAAVIIAILFCVICICIILGSKRGCKCGPKIGATNKGQPAPYEDVEIQDMKVKGYFSNPNFKTDSIGPVDTMEQDTENKYAEIGATYQEISPRTCDPKQPAWARTSSALTNTSTEQAAQEYSSLVQVGGHALRNNSVNSMSDINSEQYAQLMISK